MSNQPPQTPHGTTGNAGDQVNYRTLLISIVVCLVLFLVSAFGWSLWSAHSGKPSTNQQTPAGDGTQTMDKGH